MALSSKERTSVNRVASLVLENAMIFQEVLSHKEPRVDPLRSYIGIKDPIGRLADHWKFIIEDINYHPIFRTAHDILRVIPANDRSERAIQELLRTAIRIVTWKAALRHDLAGRLYHRVLLNAKYLGAYYTRVPSAALLLKLALEPDDYDVEWADLDSISQLRIADLACGTGTLLMAAADVVADNYLRACAIEGVDPDLDELHRILLEKVLYGYDVVPSAIHLTASTLMLRAPDDPVAMTHLHRVPFGGDSGDLGSLELLEVPKLPTGASGETKRVTGKGEEAASLHWVVPKLNLCVMNPPFTSSRRANLLFGTLPDEERKRMQSRLKRIVKEQELPASITAGLASPFTAMSSRYIKDKGSLALVLPKSILSGVSWQKTRSMIASEYEIKHIITCHEPGFYNFSENTSLSEALLIAKKSDERSGEAKVICTNLWKNPRTPAEALAIASELREATIPDLVGDARFHEVGVGTKKYGEAFAIPMDSFKEGAWDKYFAFAQSHLVKRLQRLGSGEIVLNTEVHHIPLTRLGRLGYLGYDPRDVFDAFEKVRGRTEYPTLWGHKSDEIRSMGGSPNGYLKPLVEPRKGRKLRDARHLWKKAGRLLIAMRLRFNTTRVMAVRLEERVLCNVWWAFTFTDENDVVEKEKALALWLNSSLNAVLMLGSREETEGSYMQFKKPTLHEMSVLDVSALDKRSLKQLATRFDELAHSDLMSFSDLSRDPGRERIDQALADILDLPSLDDVRSSLGREPIVSGTCDRL